VYRRATAPAAAGFVVLGIASPAPAATGNSARPAGRLAGDSSATRTAAANRAGRLTSDRSTAIVVASTTDANLTADATVSSDAAGAGADAATVTVDAGPPGGRLAADAVGLSFEMRELGYRQPRPGSAVVITL